MTPIAPPSLVALAEAIAASAPAPLTVRGAGTKARSAPESTAIDMRALSGLVAYDPAECVVSVHAGTPVADLAATLAPHGQYLPWDPPLAADGATIHDGAVAIEPVPGVGFGSSVQPVVEAPKRFLPTHASDFRFVRAESPLCADIRQDHAPSPTFVRAVCDFLL